ncbi:MAG: 16S rRNA (guanine(527)-N(7))-methyltransferase RsmG [bacterium]
MNGNPQENAAQEQEIAHEIIKYLPETANCSQMAHALHVYYLSLKAYNLNVNLVADDSFKEFLYRHVLDSLSVFKAVNVDENDVLVDIGSGAGFPGLPIKICFPSISLISVESIAKKANFQSVLAESLNLKQVSVENVRAEAIAKTGLRGTADKVVSRALASLPILLELSLPLLKIGGKAIFYKTSSSSDELKSAENALFKCGGEIFSEYDYRIRPEDPLRKLLIIKKTSKTPEIYPRNTGVPFKRPL